MKTKKYFSAALFAAFCISGTVNAQETEIKTVNASQSTTTESKATINTSRSNIKNNTAKEVAANSSQCLVSLISNAGGCEIAFSNEVKSPSDVATGQASSRPGNAKTGTVSYKPSSFTVSSSDNSVSEIKSPRDVATGQSSGKSAGNPIKGISVKGGKNPGGNQFNNLVVKNGQVSLPADCPNGDCDLILSWSWGASNSGNAKSYCQCHFILTMQDGACVAIKTKGTGAEKN